MGRVTDTDRFLLLLHIIAAFWYVMGLAVVQLSYIRGLQDHQAQAEAFNEASHYQGVLMVPGAIAVGFTGVFLWANVGYNLLTTGWLLALEVLYIVTLFVCLPVIGIGLRRARVGALKARRAGSAASGNEADNVPLVFGSLATLLVPAMTALAVFQPF